MTAFNSGNEAGGKVCTLQEITLLLTDRVKVGPEVAGAFLKEVATVLSQGITTDGSVTIDGLGTFRATADVEGNPTVEFAPDPSFADSVNKPFAIFESVELAEDVDESSFDESGHSQSADAETAPPAAVEPQKPQEEAAPEPSAESSAPEETASESYMPEPPVPEVGQPAAAPEPAPVPPPIPSRFVGRDRTAVIAHKPQTDVHAVDDMPVEETPEAPVHVIPDAPVHTVPDAPFHVIPDAPVAVRIEPESEVRIRREGHSVLTLVFACLAAGLFGVLLGGVIWYILFGYHWQKINNQQVEDVIEVEESVCPDSVLFAVSSDDTLLQAKVDSVIRVNEDGLSQTQKNVTDAEAQPTPQKVVTDTVGPGNYLSRIARRHYGNPRFWVYIYLANRDKIADPDNVAKGTVVTIPSRETYDIDPDNPESVKKAEREATRIRNGQKSS